MVCCSSVPWREREREREERERESEREREREEREREERETESEREHLFYMAINLTPNAKHLRRRCLRQAVLGYTHM